jgi:Flp pilus assembly protein TadG
MMTERRIARDVSGRQRGLALVEAAIALPLLLLLLLPVVEFARAFIQYSTLAHHGRAATRYLAERVIDDTTGVPELTGPLIAQAQQLAVYGQIAGGTNPVIPGLTTASVNASLTPGGQVRLRIIDPYRPIVASVLPAFGFGDDVPLAFSFNIDITMRPL